MLRPYLVLGSFDGPVKTDCRYYRSWYEYAFVYISFSEVLDVSVNSVDSSKLHNFVSSELQMRGIMIWAHVVTIDNDDLVYDPVYSRARHEVLLTRQRNSVGSPSLNRAKVEIYWDENLPSSEDDARQWHRLQKVRSSELLFTSVLASLDREEVERGYQSVDGLVLWEKHLPDRGSVFVRLGKFQCGVEFLDMLVTKLDLQPATDLGDGIDLDDARLADLVHKVTII